MTDSTSIFGSSVSTSGIGGLISGLDTKSLVEQMALGTQIKINRNFQAKQKLLYQQEAFRNITSKLVSFSEKYFSYTSKNNILSTDFFKSSSATSSNDSVKVSGDTDAIKNFQINSITSVADYAKYTSSSGISSNRVEALYFGIDNRYSKIDDTTIEENRLAGQTITLSVDGKNYNLTFDSNFKEKTIDKIAQHLNEKINDIDDIKDKISYRVDGDRLVLVNKNTDAEFSEADSTKVNVKYVSQNISDILKIKASTKDDISYGSSTQAVTLERRTLSGKSISFKVGENTYSISFENDFDSQDLNAIAEHLNTKIEANNDLKGKFKYIVKDDKLVVNKSFDFKDSLVVESVDSNITDILKIAKDSNGSSSSSVNFNSGNIVNTHNLKDTILNGSGITINYNGITKTFKFDEDEFENNYSLDKLTSVLNDKVQKSFGDNISIEKNIDGTGLKINLNNSEGNYLTISNIDSTLGAFLGLESGDGTRIALNDSIDSLELNDLTESDNIYKIMVNDVEIEIDASKDCIKDVMNKINNSDAGVNVTYSSTTDKFYIVSKETGSHQEIAIKDVKGNLSNKIFGISDNTSTPITGKDTVMQVSLNGEELNINRSTSSFTLDGINIELNNKAADNSITEDNPITFTVNNNIDEVTKKVAQFVEDYNEIITMLDNEVMETPNKDYPPLTEAQRKEMSESEIKSWEEKAKEGMLYCNNTISSALYDLRDAASNMIGGITLDDIGITTATGDYTGKLVFDEDKFKEKYAEDSSKIADLFTKDSDDEKGIALQLKEVVYNNVGIRGEKGYFAEQAGTKNTSSEKTNYLSERIKEYEETIEKLKDKMEDEKERYWKQFSALESALAQMNSQSSWLASYQ